VRSRRRIGRASAILLVLLLALVVGSCSSLGYLSQSIWGHTRILAERRSIERLLQDEATPAPLQRQLQKVLEIRQFASHELHLPDNGSYRSYAEIERPYVVWNVVAAPELSVDPLLWCFPVVGCVSYRGYFSQRKAERFADRLRRRGYDVDTSGVTAYSTIGWFRDPVLSTFIERPDAELAGLIFHELAHQVVYVKDDTTFNESFATFVEQDGVRRWLTSVGRAAEIAAYERGRDREAELTALLLRFRARLEGVFNQDRADDWKRRRKSEILADLRDGYEAFKRDWDGFAGYDDWFSQELNNADLASVGAYHELVPAFRRLLAQQGGDLARFFDEVRRLATQPAEERIRLLGSGPVP
jgi:predicted aminopeptidase